MASLPFASLRTMTGLLLTVGDEILLGQIVNTNAAWLGERLAEVGVDVDEDLWIENR